MFTPNTEALVKKVQTTPSPAALIPLLAKAPASVLAGKCPAGDPLDVLSPEQHSLGYSYFLMQRCQSETKADELAVYLLRFVETFSRDQMLLDPMKFNQLGAVVAKLITNGLNPTFGIRVLMLAIQRFRPTPGHLTGLHASMLQLALVQQRPHTALALLEQPITHIDAKLLGSKLDPFLLYHYYGGVVYALLKRYREAMLFFQQMIELPQYASGVVLRTCRGCATVYNDLMPFFDSSSIGELCNYIQTNKQALTEDGNYTLALLLPNALRNLVIKRLPKIYSNMSLARIAEMAELRSAAEVEQHILAMVNANELRASITRRGSATGAVEGTVQFEGATPPTGRLPPDVSQEGIAQLMQQVAALSELVRNAELQLATSTEFMGRSMGAHMEDMSMDEVDYMVGNISSAVGAKGFH
ncbi:hypothetical protein SYNPS1DRAFT_28632 [Syncephalis pseudoplumigaleata]|uniref:COP9 signalosome complex subunit 3 n=1 Tax=Syncephalis pseudoplumigaleata TaxID=1712513 RepID=A0A4P9Z146_9FUNG|nr:hypothetical protein SYNPS1DRAFT_28632 [Syncephalis pseudoplumigaleata]|eukprot:RKP25642.1 hypothetical protein SYNPS1DRAFT_28632 [Syncephalis pseudoplumigaleata]